MTEENKEKPMDAESLAEYMYERRMIPYTLDELFKDVCKWIYLDNDRDFFDVILACSCDRQIEGEPLWLYGISVSGGTKSTMANVLRDREAHDIYMLDTLTEHTLVSGKLRKTKDGLEPVVGLLPQIDGKVLIIKDFTWILGYNADKRREIFGQLRTIYDGYVDAGFGTMGKKLQIKARIGLIAFVTPHIDDFTTLEALLGTRFLRIRHRTEGFEREIEQKASSNFGKEDQIMEQISWLTTHFVRNLDFSRPVNISNEWMRRISQLAHYIALMRTQVQGEWWKGELQAIVSEPQTEIPTRLVKQLIKLSKLLVLIRGKPEFTEAEWNTLVRVAEDTIMPYTRSKILKLILKNNYEVPSINSIAQELKISRTHVRATLLLMEGCYILQFADENTKDKFELTDKAKTSMMMIYEPEKLQMVRSTC